MVTYNCPNNHKKEKIQYNKFYNEKYISKKPEILCQQCKQEKLNYNNILSCNTCQTQLCTDCILKHKFLYSHTNFGIIDNSINKCNQHNIDISQYCKTCKNNLCVFRIKKGDKKIGHNEHDIINFSDLIPDNKEIENNNIKLDAKIQKNLEIINKINKWKEEIFLLIDNLIKNLNCEIMINKMIIKNFNWKYLDYTNYLNYNEALDKIEKVNIKLEPFMNSKTIIEETNAIIKYIFEKKIIMKIIKKMTKK